ncbi:4-amino-4-deoxychorismate lyase [Cohnella kolymensis]|uniref:4-amino-4-deoxychorismate lyase n=1 Tax=Cohnella kolymensis TaxID=1590652 RepID=A0ABR5A1P7_9BACL|nr:aminotransferase class IV [Cohnella kolymensis]KIL34974.1 4-amino-4-deoxychorismate lyase [Cohnella kolymensis]
MKLLWNGELIDSKQTVISALDHGFLYGMGLFETFRTYNGRPWLLERHAARLSEGCEILGFAYMPDLDRMEAAVRRVLEANGLADGYIRWSISAGEGSLGLPTVNDYDKPNEIVYAKELSLDHPAARKGKTLRLLHVRRSTPEHGVRLKSFHYMNNIVAKGELITSGAGPLTEGLFLDSSGYAAEGIVSNVFWVKDGALFTPSPETGLLPGITRAYVLELAEGMGISIEQGLFEWKDLLNADEVFLTNSIQEIVPVTRVEDKDGHGTATGGLAAAGPLTYQLMLKYRAAAEGTGAE